VGYNFVADNTGLSTIFIRLVVIASETREMARNFKRIWPYGSSRSSKVIDLGVNGKRICVFLLDTNRHYGRISYRFQDGAKMTLSSKIACCLHPTLAWRPLAMERLVISTKSIYRWKVILIGYNYFADISGLSSFV